MAEFKADLQSFRPIFPLLNIDSMEFINQLETVNPHVLDNSNFNYMMPFSSDTIFGGSTQPELPTNLEENFSGLVYYVNYNAVPASLSISSSKNDTHEDKKRKATMDNMTKTSSLNSTHAVSKNDCGGVKKVKRVVTENKESKEVVHVRARRGQATDNHSLAERVRRGKINDKLRCLQNIVPGCHKTMGMAIMFDEIINYVQSLQHQVEFLSMKLSAASTFYDFNSDTDALEIIQRERASEAEDYVREG
ncbi:hypothetical protein TanjilG_32797 [Lupinus angustifolius]|uniref:BHLH domain-containing protein n=1 Tax=Lupinus angustifolius TaxID=3871 RepID=A0A4P1RG00_LUPAN|nr:PREDICTED: transcription factor BEE 1-like [Lupinus angustifolius]OIW10057.1 hypothetical protein TanjilG_32797 [Lupinus angustifolius]